MVGVGYDDGRLAVVEDVGDLVAVEAGVDRHGHETGVPDGELRLEVLGPVAHHDGDPVPGRQAEVVAQTSGRTGRLRGERTPAGVDAPASVSAGPPGRRRPSRSTQTARFIAPPRRICGEPGAREREGPARSLPQATAPRVQPAPASSASPNDAAIGRLVTAVIVEQHDEWAADERRYPSETLRG
jgi:hypothetical protein